jgi:hypothetical protein
LQDCLNMLQLVIGTQLEAQVLHTESHVRLQCAQCCWLGLVLLVSRQLIMAAASRVKLTRRS